MSARQGNGTATAYRMVVVGAGYAGMAAAVQLVARAERREDVQVTLVNAQERFTERMRLHMTVTGQQLAGLSISGLLEGMGAQFVRGWVTAVEPDARTVRIDDDSPSPSMLTVASPPSTTWPTQTNFKPSPMAPQCPLYGGAGTEANANPEGVMSDGIQWLADEWDYNDLNVTFARGISPQDLAVRLGADTDAPLQMLTSQEAETMIQRGDCARVARVGESGEWSFAVEPICPSRAWWGKPDLSRGDVEVIHLTPKPYDPPKEFWYYRSGDTVGRFDFGEQPGGMEFLTPALQAVGAMKIMGRDGVYEEIDDETRKILAAIERHFSVSLPRADVIDGSLPAAVTAVTHPENPGD